MEKYPLYYVVYSEKQTGSGELGYMKEKYINVEVKYTAEDELRGLEANKCYFLQFTAKEMEEDRVAKLKDTSNRTFFRRFAVVKGKRYSF
jgi:phosphodiesterase/alkaline phosphatase D-like protein